MNIYLLLGTCFEAPAILSMLYYSCYLKPATLHEMIAFCDYNATLILYVNVQILQNHVSDFKMPKESKELS